MKKPTSRPRPPPPPPTLAGSRRLWESFSDYYYFLTFSVGTVPPKTHGEASPPGWPAHGSPRAERRGRGVHRSKVANLRGPFSKCHHLRDLRDNIPTWHLRDPFSRSVFWGWFPPLTTMSRAVVSCDDSMMSLEWAQKQQLRHTEQPRINRCGKSPFRTFRTFRIFVTSFGRHRPLYQVSGLKRAQRSHGFLSTSIWAKTKSFDFQKGGNE